MNLKKRFFLILLTGVALIPVTAHLDAKQAGVGTATCGPGVLPQSLVLN